MKLVFNSLLTLILAGLFSCRQQTFDDDQIVSFFGTYAVNFNPKSIGLEESLDDSAKLVLNMVDMKNTAIIKKLKPSVEIIILKQLLNQYKLANMSYDFYHSSYPNSNKILFIFCLNNGIDTNVVLKRQYGNLAFPGDNVYEIVSSKNDGEISIISSSLLNQIAGERKRVKNE